MFQINEYVIHGENGVCKVDDICTPPFNGIDKNKKYYVLHPVYSQGRTIYSPIDTDKPAMRHILSEDEAKQLINRIPSIDTIWVENEKFREQSYKTAMQKYECQEWIKIIKTLYLRREEKVAEGKKLSTTDERYLRMAEDYLYGELSISLGIPRGEIENYITREVDLIEQAR